MLFNFFKKKESEETISSVDPVIEEQVEQTAVRFEQDVDAIRDRLEKEYPSAQSAIEDFRKGYVTDVQLALCFTQDEIDTIHEEAEQRDIADSDETTLGLQ